jgi:hypothetical protein
MDKRFLHKVVDQIVRETRIDYDRRVIKTPLLPSRPYLLPSPFSSFSSRLLASFSFSDHCRDVYGLNEEEINYVWEEYKRIIKDKINSNG